MTIPPIRWTVYVLLALFVSVDGLLAQFSQSTYTLSVGTCEAEASLCSGYSESELAYYGFELNGTPFSPTWKACNEQQRSAYDMTGLPEDGYSGPYDVVDWAVNGTPVTGRFNSPQQLADILLDADPAGAWSFDSAKVIIVGGASGSTYSNLEVYHPLTNRNYLLPLTSVTVGGTAEFSFPVGNHTLRVLDGATQVERVEVEVTCPTPSTVTTLNLTTPSVTRVCPDLGPLSGPIDPQSITLTPQPRHVSFALVDNGCFEITAFGNGTDSTTLRYCDASDQCNSVNYVITARPAVVITPSTVFDTVEVDGDVVSFCIDTTQLPGVVTSVRDICAASAGTYVDFTLINGLACVKYRGVQAGGSDTSCIVVCDNLGFCDTTRVIVTTTTTVRYPDQELFFTIPKDGIGSTLLDFSAFQQNVTSLVNACPEQSGSFVDFRLDLANRSVDFLGKEVGTERACVTATAADGSNQTFRVTVRVIAQNPARDTLRMRNGDSREWCFGAYELPGLPVRLYDACVAASPVSSFTPSAADVSCVRFVAERLGIQELCMTLCDAEGACDLVDLVIEVVPNDNDLLPTATDDAATIGASGVVTLRPLDNDVSADPITYAAVVTRPSNGTASFGLGGTLDYVATTADCLDDELVYEICNKYGCDQATIRLTADCDGAGDRPNLIAASGFSPNGDGVNDLWVLKNIERYPNAVVKVYNRWGARVLEVTNYGNDWDGTFGGDLLPDGTYYFVADLIDASPVGGYVQIRR